MLSWREHRRSMFLSTSLSGGKTRSGIDRNSARLARRAKNYAQFHRVSFGESLDRLQRIEAQDAASASAVDSNLLGARLSQMAYRLVHSRGLSFEEALTEAAEENPELTR